jgi:predicted transposase YbfD/YdcC
LPKKTFKIAEEQKVDLLIQVKDNQENLVSNIADVTLFCKPDNEVVTLEKSRGRVEHRTTKVYSAAKIKEFIEDQDWMRYISVILWVIRVRKILNKKTGLWETTTENHYYIVNTQKYNGECLHQAVRDHWAIENKNHYVRDVTLREDASTIRQKPTLMARIRSLAMNIMKANGETNISGATFSNALNINRILKNKYIF